MALSPPDGEDFSIETRAVSPAHFLIKIESFSLLSEHEIQKYETGEFAAGDYKWKLVIYPDGRQSNEQHSEDKLDHVSAFLTMVGTSSLPVDWEVNAMFTFFLYNHFLDNYLCFRGRVCRFHTLKFEWGFSKLISRKSFTNPTNGYLVDDNCFIGAEVFVIKSQRVFERLSIQSRTNPEKHVMEILNFNELKDVWISEEFSAGDCKWKIELYSYENRNADKDENVSIYLQCVNLVPPKKVNAEFCVRIKNQLDDSCLSKSGSNWFMTSATSWGWSAFAPVVDLQDPRKGFIVGNRCVIEVDVCLLAITSDMP